MSSSVRIALLGNFTTEYLSRAIEDECKKHFIETRVYNSEYNRYNQEILNPKSKLYSFKPSLTFLCVEGEILFAEWYKTITLLAEPAYRLKLLDEAYSVITNLIETLHRYSNTKIIFNSFKIPYHSPLGILDCKTPPGLKQMVGRLNALLEEFAVQKDYFYIFDYNGLCSQIGYLKSQDKKMYYIAKNVLSTPLAKMLAREYMRYILPAVSRNRKCLVLDLDNTLWGGIAGEDGISGIRLDVDGPGKSYFDFQQELLNLYHKGILLAVNSKNNLEDAMSIIDNHPHMLLKRDHFSCLKINWQDKARNLKEISKELNIGIDSLVFFDDNPIERAYVKSMLPEVKTIDVPEDSSKYVDTLKEICDFEYLNLTEEDRKRNEMYAANIKRLESQQKAVSVDDFLADLNTVAVVEPATAFTLPRIAQLTQKTNQFNMTSKRYSSEDISKIIDSDRFLVYSCSVSDKFGDNGLVGVCIVELKKNEAFIDSFLLSCRVLGREVEYAFLSRIVDILAEKGFGTIRSAYIRTPKNRSNCDFYLNAGFSMEAADGDKTTFIFTAGSKLKEFRHITVKH